MDKLDLLIESSLANVELMRVCVKALSLLYFDQPSCDQIEISVVEAITNCIEHGYKYQPGCIVQMSYQVEKDRIIVDVSDIGVAMNPDMLRNLSTHFVLDPDDIDSLLEGGRGLKVIKRSMDEVSYHSVGGTNHFVMVKYRNPLSLIS
jgi:serine/threonine-protein kinase RsbW